VPTEVIERVDVIVANGQLMGAEVEVRAGEDFVIARVPDELVESARIIAVLVTGDIQDSLHVGRVPPRHTSCSRC
jgi:hypothetical protein